MKLTKNPEWTRKNDLQYYLILPFEIIKTIPAILKGEPRKLNDMSWKDYIGLAQANADCKSGRWYKEVAEKVKQPK